ncbi:MAG: hypothetical protein ABI193_23720, partial [Minicystis sp.]
KFVGWCKVDIESSIQVDKQTANGKKRARTKVKAIEPAKVTLACQFTRAQWAEGNAFRITIDPGRDEGYGKVWGVGHPECDQRQVNKIMLLKMSKLDIKGDAYSFTAEGDGWTEPDQANIVGGTVTPTKAEQWQDSPGGQRIGRASNGNTFVLGATEAQGGFDGPAAPKPKEA